MPEALRKVWKPVMQAAPKVVQKQEKGEGETEEAKCCQKAEKGFPVLGLISRHSVFPPTRREAVHVRQGKTGKPIKI